MHRCWEIGLTFHARHVESNALDSLPSSTLSLLRKVLDLPRKLVWHLLTDRYTGQPNGSIHFGIPELSTDGCAIRDLFQGLVRKILKVKIALIQGN